MSETGTRAKLAGEILTLWNTDDAAARAAFAEDWIVPDFIYADAHLSPPAKSRQAFLDFLSMFRSRLPDARVELAGPPLMHNDFAMIRFSLSRGGKPFSKGVFFLSFDNGDKLVQMVGFVEG
jgi:hypothetical protein